MIKTDRMMLLLAEIRSAGYGSMVDIKSKSTI
jgi:hypothetical protein